jgi:hypothetical protein
MSAGRHGRGESIERLEVNMLTILLVIVLILLLTGGGLSFRRRERRGI